MLTQAELLLAISLKFLKVDVDHVFPLTLRKRGDNPVVEQSNRANDLK